MFGRERRDSDPPSSVAIDLDSPVGKNFISIISNKLNSAALPGTAYDPDNPPISPTSHATNPTHLPAPSSPNEGSPVGRIDLTRDLICPVRRSPLSPAPSNPFNTYAGHARFPVGGKANKQSRTSTAVAKPPAAAVASPPATLAAIRPLDPPKTSVKALARSARRHRGTGKSISFAGVDFVKMFEGEDARLGSTPPRRVENEIAGEDEEDEEEMRKRFRRERIEVYERGRAGAEGRPDEKGEGVTLGELMGGRNQRVEHRVSVPRQSSSKPFKRSSKVDEQEGALELKNLMRPKSTTPPASPTPPEGTPGANKSAKHCRGGAPASMDEKLSLHYTNAAENASIQKRARILSIYQGCFLVVFLFLLYMLFSVLSYSIWFADEIPVIDSLLVAVYTITTVGYGNQQPTSNPALAFTIWEMLSGIALLTMMVAQVLQAAKVSRESREEDAKKMERRIDKSIKSIEKRLSIVVSPPSRVYKSRMGARCALMKKKMGELRKRVWESVPGWAKVMARDILLLTFTIAAGAIAIGVTEGWSFVQSVYFAVTTMTTVGYGDVSPETDAGKILTMLYMPFSLYFMSVFLNLVANFYIACHKMNIERILNDRKAKLNREKVLETERQSSSIHSLGSPGSPYQGPVHNPISPLSAMELGVPLRTNSTMESTPSPQEPRRKLFNPVQGRRTTKDSLTIDTGAAPVTPKGVVTPKGGGARGSLVSSKVGFISKHKEETEVKKEKIVIAAKTPRPLPKTPKMGTGAKTPKSFKSLARAGGSVASPMSKWKVLTTMTPSKIRARVQSRFEMIVATELAGTRGGLQVEGEVLGVEFPNLKAVVAKWFIPKNAVQAFRAVSYEAIVGIGEFNLMKNGSKAYDLLDQEDRVLMFAPLVATMGSFEAMSAWLKGTEFVEKTDIEAKTPKPKQSNYGYALSPDQVQKTPKAKPRHKRAMSTTVISPMKRRIESGRGWRMSDFSSTPSNLKSPKFNF